MNGTPFETAWRWFCKAAPYVLLAQLALLFPIPQPIGYVALVNALGPSTQYHHAEIGTAITGPDGNRYVFIGDEFYVWITVIRHELNGNCRFEIRRYAEATAGIDAHRPKLISTQTLQFVGRNEVIRTRWPQPPERLVLGFEVDDEDEPILDRPLLPTNVEEQPHDFFVVGRYFCNALDYIVPRYIQGGRRNETGRVHAIIKRTKPPWATAAKPPR